MKKSTIAWAGLALAAVAVGIGWWIGAGRSVRDGTGYIDGRTCAACHAAIAASYGGTGMGRSFSRPRAVDLERLGMFEHKVSGRHYEMIAREGKLYQRRWQQGRGGRRVNTMEMEVHYVLGSGNHGRSFLHRTARGKLIQLPLAWYAERGGFWAMNPGYDRPDHQDFRRAVTFDCVFCHNGYGELWKLEARPGDDAVFPERLAEGIDCQRCHGPGRAHAEAAGSGAEAEHIRSSIVNPKRLSRERQLEVCMQCHLETTSRTLPYSIVRHERPFFSYRAGEPLASYILHFDHPEETGQGDKFEIAHAAYRLRKSACFNRSGTMTCTSCHDPHRAARGEEAAARFRNACVECHGAAHRIQEDCVGCHMPKRRTDDVVHVVMTDHWIQRVRPARDLLAALAEKHDSAQTAYRGEVVPYYPSKMDDELYVAIAQVTEGSNVEKGIARLESAIARRKPAEGLVYHELAEAYWRNGAVDQAIEAYQEALRLRPALLVSRRNLGAALLKKGDLPGALAALREASDDAVCLANLGEAYRRQGEYAKAKEALEKAAALDGTLAEPFNWLGRTLEASGAAERARAAYQEAIRVRPDYAEAHYHLGSMLARESPADEAERHLAEAVRWDPKLAEAHNNLGNLAARGGRVGEAIGHFRRAIEADPKLGAAHLNLGVALSETSAAEAVEHLRRAGESGDAEVRAGALRGLEAMGRRK